MRKGNGKRRRKRELAGNIDELVMYNLNKECESKDEDESNSKSKGKGKGKGKEADRHADRWTDG